MSNDDIVKKFQEVDRRIDALSTGGVDVDAISAAVAEKVKADVRAELAAANVPQQQTDSPDPEKAE